MQQPDYDVLVHEAAHQVNRTGPGKTFPPFFYWCRFENVVKEVIMQYPPFRVCILFDTQDYFALFCAGEVGDPTHATQLSWISQARSEMQLPMVFLQQLLSEHRLNLAPVPGARLHSAIVRNWLQHKLLTEFEALLHSFRTEGILDLGGVELPVCILCCCSCSDCKQTSNNA
jgi:hypothetical protein